MPFVIKHVKCYLALLFTFLIDVSPAQKALQTADFLEDIDQLEELILSRHVNPFWINSRESLQKQVKSSRDIISAKETCDQSCYVELFKIIAAINDGHSSISGGSRYDLFGYLPFTARWFNGELRVLEAADNYKELLGYRIDKVDGIGIAEVLQTIKKVVPHANDSRFKKFAPSYLHLPGLLYGLGLSKDPEQATFTLSDGADTLNRMIRNLTPEEEKNTTFSSYLDHRADLPLYQRNNDLYYWFDYDTRKDILYFQYNRVGNMKSESSSQFSKRLWSFVDSVEVEKFVLDLRYNGGGSFGFSVTFIQGILDRLDLNTRGNLFIVTGYETFSAAIEMLNQLELQTQAILVGQPPCDFPSRPGDPKSYLLENSQIKVNLSSLYHPTIFENDKRSSFLLDKEVVTDWKDFQDGIDPVLDYILKYKNDTLEKVNPKGYEMSLGRYDYSLTRHLQLKKFRDELWLQIDGSFLSPLYHKAGDTFYTEVNGLTVRIGKEQIELIFPDGKSKACKKIDDQSASAVALIYQGDFKAAEKIYEDILKDCPDFIELKDHQIQSLATKVFFELRKYPHMDAAGIARKVLNLGIKLNDGNAPFCQYSLRFY